MSALYTRCPRCATTFRAAEEQLDAAGGLVRCGACDEVFDARAHEVDLGAMEPDTPPPGLLNADYIGDMLRDAAPIAEAPAPEPQAQRVELPALRTELPPPLVELPVEVGAQARRRISLRQAGWLVALLAAALALGGQYAWLERERLAQDPGLRTRLERACAWLGCTLPPYHDPARIRSTELLVRPDPARAGVLLVDAVLENRAPFAQRYPGLELSFTDLRGQPVARRVFAPQEYLGAHPAPDARLAPREPVRVHLELKDPGEHATNYELRLVEPVDEEAARATGAQ